ncbi:MAG: inositol monophosphatase, partial [Patescibacteria group bacterium]
MNDFLKDIIKQGGAIAKDYFLKGVTFKTKSHLGDLVTVADQEVSDFLIKKIQEKYPDHGIYSEEQKDILNPGSDYLWMIDPIDGTRNFANAIPMWCSMVALFYRKELIMSAVYNPLSDELFFAEKGKGASINGMPI